MTDFEGDIEVPDSYALDGSITIRGWADIIISINKLPLDRVQSATFTRNMNIGSGTCNIKLSDPDRTTYQIFHAQDEVEIFVKASDDPPVGRKVWGGFVDECTFDINNGMTLTITGKDYISRLQSQICTYAPVAAPLSTALRAVMANQVDFSYESIPVFAENVQPSFTNETIYNAVKQMCDQWKVYFWIDPITRDMHARKSTELVASPETLIEGLAVGYAQPVPILRGSSIKNNSELLSNTVAVYGNTVTGTYTDPLSQEAHGVFSRAVTVGTIGTNTQADSYAQTLVEAKADPLDAYEIESQMLVYTDPGDYIQIISDSLGLSGFYQVLELSHSWSPTTGLRSKITANNLLVQSRTFIADMERRLKTVEKKAYA
jgi:hypothetical protein